MLRASLFGLISLLFAIASPITRAADDPQNPSWECRWTTEKITIDGKADEPAWAKAQVIDRFTTAWLPDDPVAKTTTRARLLWDATALYFHAEMEDGDLFADITEHDGETWLNDVFEFFLKPAADKQGYYEFQANAAGATFDMFVPVRADLVKNFSINVKKDTFRWQTKVVLKGTLNKRDDRDEGWSVEGRIPWLDLIHTGARPKFDETWRFSLCRYDYDSQWKSPNLSTNSRLTKPDFHQTENFAPLKFIGPQAEDARPHGIQQRLPLTTSKVVGTPDPPLPYRTSVAYPKLAAKHPIMIRHLPGTNQMLALAHERSEGGATSLLRFEDDPQVDKFETLHVLKGTAYDFTFHPRFAENGFIYIGWNSMNGEPKPQRECRISRFVLDREAPYALDPESETRIVQWQSRGHDGAAVAFGNDGLFYVTTGDGTTDGDEDVVGQDMTVLTAKLLRINVDVVTDADFAAGRHYSIPSDNPFVSLAGARPETWAYGLRNPWRMAVDPKTGHVWVTQNGQDVWEQVYFVRKGDNFGWSVTEGSHPFYLERKRGPTPIVPPAAEHPHSEARSLTGGVVYHGEKYPDLRGCYIYGDYATGKIWAIQHDGKRVVQHREIADTALAITAISLDSRGELLIANYRNTAEPVTGLHRLEPTPPATGPSTFPRRLSESGLFEPGRGHTVVPAVIPYSVNSPLWSDGSFKERFIALPGETTITFANRRSWTFPEGTVLVKSFGLETEPGNPQSRRWVETRFLTLQEKEWVGYSYEWNDDQTDAVLVEAAGKDRQYEIADPQAPQGRRKQTWHYPSRAECMVCHSQSSRYVLGVTTAQLNRDHDYGGVVDNQLRALTHAGILTGVEGHEWREAFSQAAYEAGQSGKETDAAWLALFRGLNATPQRRAAPQPELGVVVDHYERLVDPYDRNAPLELRVRSYMHTNCAHCHTHSSAGNSKILLSYWVGKDETLLVNQPPQHAALGMKNARLITPGNPDASILFHRISQRGRGQMPPISTSLVDQEAAEMIRAWIKALPSHRGEGTNDAVR